MTGSEPPSPLIALEHILDAASTPSLLVSAGERIVLANQAAARATAASAARDLLGKSLDVFDFDPAVSERNRQLFRQVASGVVLTLTAVISFRRLDGSTTSAVIAETGVMLAEGQFVLIAVAEPPEDLASLRDQQAGPDLPVLVIDHDWRVSHATGSARKLLALEDPAGTALFALVHPLDISSLANALSLLTSGSSISLRLRLRGADGWRPMVVTSAALCSHTPPRLVWLLSEHPAWHGNEYLAADQDRIEAAILSLTSTGAGGRAEFSDRELEIITRSLRGQGAAEIAREMFLNRGTVRNALTRIYRKVGVRSQTGLVSAILTGRAGQVSDTPHAAPSSPPLHSSVAPPT